MTWEVMETEACKYQMSEQDQADIPLAFMMLAQVKPSSPPSLKFPQLVNQVSDTVCCRPW